MKSDSKMFNKKFLRGLCFSFIIMCLLMPVGNKLNDKESIHLNNNVDKSIYLDNMEVTTEKPLFTNQDSSANKLEN